jgi:hypothetical protein
VTLSPPLVQVPVGELGVAAFKTELILHLSATHVAVDVLLAPLLAHVDVPVSVNPLSHVGTHDVPAATVLVHLPTSPSVGGVEKSQVLSMHFGCTSLPSTHLPVVLSPFSLLLHLPPLQVPVLQAKKHLWPPLRLLEPPLTHFVCTPAGAGDGTVAPTALAGSDRVLRSQFFSHLALLHVESVLHVAFDTIV